MCDPTASAPSQPRRCCLCGRLVFPLRRAADHRCAYAGAPLLTVQLCEAVPPAAPPSELRLWLPPDAMHAARLAAADLVAVNPVAETPAPAALPAPPGLCLRTPVASVR